ncbi:hypothetical protein MNBD_PLANCTO02-135 [hydrothermal vent metagenome]|uniref:Flagellar protein FliL n=1 Tax=hydrothermal vent metagenome TaxID=652676 RepID=A0A3B1DVM9_9ZZZZ
MATETDTENNDTDIPEEGSEETSQKKPGLLANKKVKVIGLVLIVMFAEALGMYFLLPTPSVASDDTKGGLTSGVEDSTNPEEQMNIEEVEIGKFNTTNSIASPGSTIHVSFTLVAIVSKENAVTFTADVKEKYNWRVKQAVSKVIRSASLEDLNAASQSTISRLVREEINKVLGKSYVIKVVLGEPKTMAQ